MSIQKEIERIRENVSNSLTAVSERGVEVPEESNSDDLAYLIRSIPDSNVSADWSINDPEETGYIQNRTHYNIATYETLYEGTKTSTTSNAINYTEFEIVAGNAYRITIDGVSYDDLVADDEGKVGDHQMISPPFEMWSGDGTTTLHLGYDYASVPVALKVESMTITGVKQLAEKYIPDTIARKSDITGGGTGGTSAPADWSVDDPGAPGYVKNRTHYEIIGYEQLYEGTKTASGSGNITYSEFALEQNAFYRFTINGVPYANIKCVAGRTGDSNKVDPPFYTTYMPGVSSNVTIQFNEDLYANQSVTLIVEKQTVTGVKTLDEKYIPDTIARTSDLENISTALPDWSVNDPDAPGYVKHRTHWADDPIITTILEETTVEVSDDEPVAASPSDTTFVEGSTYTVTLNETEYNCTAYSVMGMVAIGNSAIAGSKNDTGEPFFFGHEEGMLMMLLSAGGTYTVSIIGKEQTYHTLDKMFLPKLIGAPGTGTSAEVFNDVSTNQAIGMYSHAEGMGTAALGEFSHAEGTYTRAEGFGAHAEGYETAATGYYSHAEGFGTIASGDHQHAAGKYNQASTGYAHILGGGYSTNERFNIHTIDWRGNAWFAGNLTLAGNPILGAPNGKSYDITVDNNGMLEANGVPLLPTTTAEDAGKFLRVSSEGHWAAESVPNAEEASF